MGADRSAARARPLWLAFALPLLSAATAFALACGGAGVTAPTVEVQQPTPMATPTAGAGGDPGVTVANVVTACREKNSERLQSLISVPVSGQDIQRMWANGSDVQLLTQTIPDASEGLVTIDVTLRVTNADGEATVQRTWDLVRGSDAVWRLTALPNCY